MKTLLRLLLLACLLPVLPAFAGEPADIPAVDSSWLAPAELRSDASAALSPLDGVVYAALSCNSVCWQQYQACLAGCNNELCRDYCREAKIECSCNCGLGIC